MASASGIRAGKAYVEVGTDNNPLYAGLKAAEQRIRTLGTSIESVGSRFNAVGSVVAGVGATLTRLGAGASAPFAFAIKAAGDMTETVSKLEAVFKADSAAVKAWADSYGKAVGRSQLQIQSFLADTGAKLSSFGFGTKDAAKLSETISALAVDLASFNNMSDADSIQALMSGISGESEPLKRFGVLLNETKLKAELMSKGISPEAATDQQKALARLSFILKRTKDAQGDAIRTSGSFNNQMKALGGTISDVSVSIGQKLIPVATALVSWGRNAVDSLGKFANQNEGLVRTLAAVSVGVAATGIGLLVLSGAIKTVGFSLVGVGSIFKFLAATLGFILSPLGLIISGVTLATVAFFKFSAAGSEALQWLGQQFQGLAATATTTFKGIADALSSGDIVLAGQILWAGLNVAFIQGINALSAMWSDWTNTLKNAFSSVTFAISGFFVDAWTGIQSGFINTIGALQDGWTAFVSYLQQSWNNFGGFFAKVWEYIKSLFSGGDVQAEIDKITADVNAKNGQVQGEALQTIIGRSGGRNAQLQGIEANRVQGKDALGAQQQALIDQRSAASQEALKVGAESLARAQAELGALRGVAAEKAVVGPQQQAQKFGGMDPTEIQKGLTRVMRTTETKGTFNAAAVRGLNQGDSVIDAVKDGTKEAKRQTDELTKMRRTVEQAGRLA